MAQSQKTKDYFLKINFVDDDTKISKFIKYNTSNRDTLQVNKQIQNVINELYAESFFYSKVTKVYWVQDTCKLEISIGNRLKISHLKKGTLPDWLLRKIDFKESYFNNQNFKPDNLSKLFKKIISYSENNGYPFSNIHLDSVQIVDNKIIASVDFNIGPFFKFDTLILSGKSKIRRQFLENYLRIEPGQPFDQQKIENIERSIKQLPYIILNGPIGVFFNEGKVRIELILEDKKSSQVDGILGLLPNSKKDGGVLLTGEFNLLLRNLFQTGKMLKGEWKRFQEESQQLNLEYYHPNVFTSDFDVSGSFNFLKQDSTFLNVNEKLSFFYRFKRNGKLSLNLAYISSRIGNNSTFKSASVLPGYSDYDYVSYGLGYDYNQLDNLFYPRRGFLIHVDASIGNKNVIKNAQFDEKLYKGINTQSAMLIGNIAIEKYFRIKGNSILLLKTVGGKISNSSIFFNDLYRLGGLKTIRGFNDNYFYASDYNINTLEFRQYLDESSYLLIFAEQSYIYHNLTASKQLDYPYSLGFGISFTSGPGIFSFIYSVGKSKQQQMDLNQSKIHFGIVSRF